MWHCLLKQDTNKSEMHREPFTDEVECGRSSMVEYLSIYHNNAIKKNFFIVKIFFYNYRILWKQMKRKYRQMSFFNLFRTIENTSGV